MAEASVHFFAGKGGSGKSTLAASHALHLTETSAKDRVLVVSLEPGGGLAEVLKKPLGPRPSKLAAGKGSGGLWGVELDLAQAAEAWARDFKAPLLATVGKGALASEDDIKKVLEAALVNAQELGLLTHLKALSESGEWERIVVDGFSTSAAVRLFEQPHAVRKTVALVRGERLIKSTKSSPRPAMPADVLVAQLEALQSFLKDARRFSVVVCAVAEPVAESQTKFLMRSLAEKGVPVERIVANMIEDGKGSREVGNRRGLQAPHVRKYQQLHPKVDLLHRRIVGPAGLDALSELGAIWASGKETRALAFSPAEAPPALVRAPSMPPIAAPPLPPTRYIFFVGSGGVGKSSCAAAAAVTLTEKEGPVLLISTDPSHSLSDVLQSRLTDTETQVKGTKGLYAREIDFANWFTQLKKKLKELAEPLFGPEQRGEGFALDRELFRNLLDAAPFGIDELPAMTALTDALVQERFKRIVIDVAPVMNGLRLLELPAVARGWFKAIHAVALKFKNKGGAALLAYCEHQLSHIDRFEAALVNPSECRFVVVTRGEELAVPAAEHLVERLKEKKLPVERVLVNRVLPKTTCEVTEERRANELEVAKVVEKRIGLPVTMAPALGRHPAGLRELKAFRTSWYALSATTKVKAA